MLHLMYYIILHPKRHQVGHSNREIRQQKHQVHCLSEKYARQVRHLISKEYANQTTTYAI